MPIDARKAGFSFVASGGRQERILLTLQYPDGQSESIAGPDQGFRKS